LPCDASLAKYLKALYKSLLTNKNYNQLLTSNPDNISPKNIALKNAFMNLFLKLGKMIDPTLPIAIVEQTNSGNLIAHIKSIYQQGLTGAAVNLLQLDLFTKNDLIQLSHFFEDKQNTSLANLISVKIINLTNQLEKKTMFTAFSLWSNANSNEPSLHQLNTLDESKRNSY
jgi:flagellar hook assembly protein FlgD